MLRHLAIGTAVLALGLLLLVSLGLMALALSAIVIDISRPTDFAMGLAIGTIGLLIWTPIAITAALALRWVWRRRKDPIRITRRHLAATAVPIGGVAVIVGSASIWGTCPDTSCGLGGGSAMVLVARSGLSWGPGLLTLVLGLVLVVAYGDAVRTSGSIRAWRLAFGASVIAMSVVVLWALRMFVFADLGLYGPGVGVYLVAIGGLAAALSSPSLRNREPRRTTA